MVTNKNELNELYWNCDTDTVNSHEYSMKGFRKVNGLCVDLRPFFETQKFLTLLTFGKML